MTDPTFKPLDRIRAALAEKDWNGVDAELKRFSKYMGKQVLNPKLDDFERVGVFALGLLSTAARRALPKGKKK